MLKSQLANLQRHGKTLTVHRCRRKRRQAAPSARSSVTPITLEGLPASAEPGRSKTASPLRVVSILAAILAMALQAWPHLADIEADRYTHGGPSLAERAVPFVAFA